MNHKKRVKGGGRKNVFLKFNLLFGIYIFILCLFIYMYDRGLKNQTKALKLKGLGSQKIKSKYFF